MKKVLMILGIIFGCLILNMVFYDVIGAAYVNIIATILMTIPILFIGWVIIKVIKLFERKIEDK